MRILIIDSDRDFAEMLANWLKSQGYEVYRAWTIEQIKTLWVERKPDLVMFDTAWHDEDLLALCHDLRSCYDTLTLVMTEGKGVQDEIRCLESGVDDYLRKPFFPTQLLARIHAVSRRARATLNHPSSSSLVVGPLQIDILHNDVVMNGRHVRLTPTECKMLHFLALHVNDVCTADQIVDHVWGYDKGGDTCLIKAHIRHLRQKIEPDASSPQYITTVSGVGYSFLWRAGHAQDDTSVRPLHAVAR